MNWHQFNTNDLSPDKAFETLCNQLFNIWIKKKKEGLKKFRVINGSGGDGGTAKKSSRSMLSIGLKTITKIGLNKRQPQTISTL